MKRIENIGRSKKWLATLLLAAAVAGCTSGGDGGGLGSGSDLGPAGFACVGASCVPLGTSANYAVFANTGIATDAGASVITGNIGTGPGVTSTAITGFSLTAPPTTSTTSAQVSGKVHAFDYDPPTPTTVNTASNDMGAAYTAAGAKAPSGGGLITACPGVGNMSDGTGGGSGGPIVAGVYTCGVNVNIPGDLTLNGSATDVWVFQITGTLNQATATTMHLTGGALPQNVFWAVSGAVTIGANAHFEGIILGQTSITMGNLSSINGRLLAQSAVTLDMTTVAQP